MGPAAFLVSLDGEVSASISLAGVIEVRTFVQLMQRSMFVY